MDDGSEQAPYYVICEGPADRALITRLLQVRWGVTDFSVRCTHSDDPDNHQCAGKSGLTATLRAADAVRAIHPRAARGIAIVFDSDDNPTANFKSILDSIKAAKLSYPVPTAPLEIARRKDAPSIAIALLPWHDTQGHLDELVFEALQQSHADLLQPIADYRTATAHRTGTWRFSIQSKMKLRCMIAASFEKDPSRSLAYLLEGSDCPVDFKHSCFDRLVAFLDEFRAKA
jgi:hypothetical protein